MTAGSVAVPTIIPLKVASGSKRVIDTATPIELRSGMRKVDSLVYYTIDGTRPDPFQQLGKRSTYRYKAPFKLSAGKVTIKAIAVSGDQSSQSSVVTKTFMVHKAMGSASSSSEEEEEDGISLSQTLKLSLSQQLKQKLNTSSRTSSGLIPDATSLQSLPGSIPRSASAPLTIKSPPTKSQGLVTSSLSTASASPKPPTRVKPICVYCKAPRPRDSRNRYCTHCGARLPPIPKDTARPPLQLAVCPSCRAEVSPGTTTCVVCESTLLQPTPLPVIQAQAEVHQEMKVGPGGMQQGQEAKSICLECGTQNPTGLEACVTCENPLTSNSSPPPVPPPPLPPTTTMQPISGSSYLMCGLCGRVNVSDARFCDWCGSRPQGSQISVTCRACSATNEWNARHCSTCGGLVKAPPRPQVELSSTMKMPVGAKIDKSAWIPIIELDDTVVTRSLGTQTQGLFYPSAKSISTQKGAEFTQKIIKMSARDRIPNLETYSPGKGLWRMQVEHVCMHLKAHSQSSHDFQGSIGTAQMGKLVHASVIEDENELNLKLAFALKGAEEHTSWRRTSKASVHSDTSLRSRAGSITSITPKPTLLAKKKRPRRNKSEGSSVDTHSLASELSATGKGRPETVQTLIEQGGDVNGVSQEGLQMLSLAAANGHVECINVLVERGATLDAQAKRTGNTALHEAALKGPLGRDAIESLLRHGANARNKNKEGLTPCELADRLGHDALVKLFAAHVARDWIDTEMSNYT